MAKYQLYPIDRTFFALSDPVRRQILQKLRNKQGVSVTELTKALPIKMPGTMKHLAVLSDAGLISREKNGRIVTVRLRPEPMKEAVAWLEQYQEFWNSSLDRLASFVEERGGE